MAWARITQRWTDGTEVEAEVGCDTPGYPDVLAELVVNVKALWRDVAVEVDGEET